MSSSAGRGTKWAQLSKQAAVGLAMAASALLATREIVRVEGDFFLGLTPLLVIALPLLLGVIAKSPQWPVLVVFLGLSLISEGEDGWIGLATPFKVLGHYLNSPYFIKRLIGLPFRIQDAFFLGFAAWVAFKRGHLDWKLWRVSRHFQVMLILALLVPAVESIAVLVGILKGRNIETAITLFRYIFIYPFAIYLGYASLRGVRDIKLLFGVVVACMLGKSAEALYLYYGVLNQNLRGYEYLMEHWTSDYMATAMTIIVAVWVRHLRGRLPIWAALAGVAVIGLPWILNDRRSSLFGVLLTIVLLPVIWYHLLRLRHLAWLGAAALAGVGFVLLTWNAPPPLNFVASTFDSVLFPKPSELGGIYAFDYRELENFNLVTGLGLDPFLGMGLGSKFPKTAPMADISMWFPFWDSIPHNQLFATWAFAGPLGIAGLGTLAVMALAVSVRLARKLESPWAATLGVVTFTCVVRWLVWVYGDLGLIEVRLIGLVGVMIGATVRMLELVETKAAC